LYDLADKIRRDGKGKDFDCIIGLSGGLDSSYTAYIAKEVMGLRPLLFHVDAGWNTDQAVGNIEKLVNGLGLDLYTEVVNWEEMKDIQVAFLRSGIPDQDLPQDASFFSSLYKFARQYKVKHVITGSNFSTECCREPEEWGGYLGVDSMLFNDIHNRFGLRPLKSFPIKDILIYKLYYQKILRMQVHHPLNLVPFIKKDAEDQLERLFGWQRFKIDRISRPEMSEHFLRQEFEYVAHKLDLTVPELQKIFDDPNKTYRDYRNKRWIIGLGANVMRWLGAEKRYFR
jgi:PP-loop superfamily ATP-utilizing enzyme